MTAGISQPAFISYRDNAATRVDAIVLIVSKHTLGLRHLNLWYPMEKVEGLFHAAGVGVSRNSD